MYVVCNPTAGGWRGGGKRPDLMERGGLGIAGDDGTEEGRFRTEEVGEDAAEERGVPDALPEGAGDRGAGTTSG